MTFLSSFSSDDLRLFERARVVLVDPAREPGGGRRRVGRRTSRAVAATRASWKLNDGRRARTRWKHCRAAFRNSLVNLAISFAAALAWASRALAPLRELVPQRRLDRVLPARNADR